MGAVSLLFIDLRIIKRTIVSFSCKRYWSGLDIHRESQEKNGNESCTQVSHTRPTVLASFQWMAHGCFSMLCYSLATKLASYVLCPMETGMY